MKLSTPLPLVLAACLAPAHPAARARSASGDDPPAASTAIDPDPIAPAPAPVGPAAARFAQDGSAFSADLWRRVRARDGNVAVSPSSIWVALGMTYGGARGRTADEMRTALHFGLPDPELHAAFANLLGEWRAADQPNAALKVANRLFGERQSRFVPAFLALTRDRYGAPLEPVDFIGAADASRVHINDWVAGRTNDRIRDLLPQGSIDELTRLVLTNAVWFKGKWRTEFDAAATRPGAFLAAPGRTVQVPLMAQTGDFRIGATDGAAVLELPYVGDRLVMDVILPDDPNGLPALEQRLDGALLARLLAAPRSSEEVDVTLPRFRIAGATISLNDVLQDMGMPTAFDEVAADFSGMSTDEHLHISHVLHKTFVEVNEEGTEAAAATAVVMGIESASMTTSFRADHPFLFAIRDTRTGSLLFLGRVSDPSA